MHCGKSTPRDHLIGMRGKFCASAISTRRWRYFFLDARVEEACAYDRVERADCGARHEANAQWDRRSKLDEAVPSRQHRESLHSTEGRSAVFADCSAGSPSAIAASFAASPGIGTLTSSRHPTVLPIRILQLCPAAHLNLSPHYSASRKSGLGVASVWSSIIVRASSSELDLGARREQS